MFGRLSARSCILSAIRFPVVFVTVEGVGFASDSDGEVVNQRLRDVQSFIAGLHRGQGLPSHHAETVDRQFSSLVTLQDEKVLT
jgi:hypothetical protein